MRNAGLEVKEWPDHRERLSRHMFILDTIRDYNKFVAEAMVRWITGPSDKSAEHLKKFQENIDDYKGSAFYTIFTEEEKQKYEEIVIKSDDEIMKEVGNMEGDLTKVFGTGRK